MRKTYVQKFHEDIGAIDAETADATPLDIQMAERAGRFRALASFYAGCADFHAAKEQNLSAPPETQQPHSLAAPPLNEGEFYAGIILGKDGAPDHHLILLPGEAEAVTWQQAEDWAASIGGELPARREQSLLFANLPEPFQNDWYWSAEQHVSDNGCVWTQHFDYGGQSPSHKSYEFRARAVRRLPI